MILIIAEKPSLARNIVSGIGKMNRKDGYFENENYLVTWAFGHLFTLYDIEDYDNLEDRKWKMDNLPFYPKEFKFNLKKDQRKHIDDGVLKQFNIIKALGNREDVDTIVNAGDSDREGEIIVRLCINNALNSEKKLVRLWLPDQTEETVKKALTEMKDEKDVFEIEDNKIELKQALNKLTDKERAVIVLRYFEEMSLNDVAYILGENLSTVKSRIYRALEKLKEYMIVK